jgi:benzaldehyde dehydrogenase (NAD)
MALLDGVAWEGKVFKGGAWTDGRGGTYAVVEPATGTELGTMGNADAEDVAEAGAAAAEAQKEWAAQPHTVRAAVLRKAGDLWAEHADEIRDWNVREVGAIPPMADFAMHVAAEECSPGCRWRARCRPAWSRSSRRSTSRSSWASGRWLPRSPSATR